MTDMSNDEISLDAPVIDTKKNLYQKLADITLNLGYVQKKGVMEIQGTKISYLRAIDVLMEVRDELACRNIICVPAMEDSVDTKVGETKSGTPIFRTVQKYTFTFIDGDNPIERLPCPFYGYAQGSGHLQAYGGATGAQRHFYAKFFNLLTDTDDPEQWHKDNPEWSADFEEQLVKVKAEDSARIPGERIGGPGHIPTREELEDSATLPLPERKPLSESWRGFPLTAWKKLSDAYPGKFVGSITLEHLLRAHEVFVANVNNRVPGFINPDQKLLANAFSDRIMWEVEQKTIREAPIGPDTKQKYEIVPRKKS